MDVLAKITELREKRNWSIYQLAQKAGLSSKALYRWYNGETTPTLKTLEAIAQVLEIPLYELFIDNNAKLLNEEEINILNKWAKLTPQQKDAVNKILDTYL